MKLFFSNRSRKRNTGGFNLVEAALSIGMLSFGFLSLIPLLALGAKTAHQAHDNRLTAQIAENMTEDIRQGALSPGIFHLDADGRTCPADRAIYTVDAALQPVEGAPGSQRLTLRIAPRGTPDRARTYAAVLPAP